MFGFHTPRYHRSQRVLRTTIGGRPARVGMGWDRRASPLVMSIEYVNDISEPLYCDERPASNGTLYWNH